MGIRFEGMEWFPCTLRHVVERRPLKRTGPATLSCGALLATGKRRGHALGLPCGFDVLSAFSGIARLLCCQAMELR